GMDRYRAFEVEAPDYEPMEFWTSEEEGDDPAAWLASLGGEAPQGDGTVADLDFYRSEEPAEPA
ncbi:MAG: hypothetical protein M3R01_10865, partial [Actinomycetota bacterium]|nr:hypothetical protein [Actinomycetota bacterium]